MEELRTDKSEKGSVARTQLRITFIIIASVAILDFILITSGVMLRHVSAAKPAPTSMELAMNAEAVTAGDLLETYVTSPERGERLYFHKMLRIAGTVTSVEQDDMGRIYVALATGEENQPVVCAFSPADGHAAANLKKGDNVIIGGTCDGFSGNVKIKDAFVVSGP